MKSLIPLILFLSAVVLLTVFLTNTGIIRKETTRNRPRIQEADSGTLSLEVGHPSIHFSASEKRPSPAARLSLDQTALDAASALVEHDYETAINNARTILVFDPQNYTALAVLGKSLFILDRPKEAEQVFLRQAVFYPKDPIVFANLGHSQAQQGKYKPALDNLQEALRLEPRSGDILLSMAGICVMDNQPKRALDYLQMAANRLGKEILPSLDQPIFDDIRNEPGFIKTVQALSEK